MNDDTPSVTFEGKCFKEITMTYERTSDSSYDLTVKRSKPKSTFCSEFVLFANPDITHTDVYLTRGTHKMTFDLSTQEEKDDISFSGLHAFTFCEGVKNTVESVWNSLKMFIDIEPSKDKK